MPKLKAGQLPYIALVVVIAWALFAVAMLTGTLVSAQGIQNRVVAINTVYPQVNKNLQSVALAKETARIAGEIDKAAKPAGPSFTKIVDSVNGIQASAQSIVSRTGDIDASVKSINAKVQSIHDVVVPIGTTLNQVDNDVKDIHDSVRGIDDKFDHILDRSRSIDDRVAGINRRAYDVRDQANVIKDNLDQVTDKTLPKIIQNSAAIVGSPIVNPLGPGTLSPLLTGLKVLPGLRVPGLQAPPALTVPQLTSKPTQALHDTLNLGSSHAPLLGQGDDKEDRSPILGGHHKDDVPLGGLLGD